MTFGLLELSREIKLVFPKISLQEIADFEKKIIPFYMDKKRNFTKKSTSAKVVCKRRPGLEGSRIEVLLVGVFRQVVKNTGK